MIDMPDAAPEAAFVKFVRGWLGQLAAGRLTEACAMLDEPSVSGWRWTPERLGQALEDAFGITSTFRLRHPIGFRWTDPDELGDGGNPKAFPLPDGTGYAVEHDVPLNSDWTELTAKFRFVRREGGFAVVLHELTAL